jgi:peptidoglycan biosynthesis protein MviN/MurJ (putative lipid II flippase)
MKRIVLLVLIGSMSWLSFADDARELPRGTLRLSQSTSLSPSPAFNLDGEKNKSLWQASWPELGAALKWASPAGRRPEWAPVGTSVRFRLLGAG